MVQDIFSYIREAYASGMTKDEMIFALRTAGWEDVDIHTAFTKYEYPKKETVPLTEELSRKKSSGIPVMDDIEPLIGEQHSKKFSLKFSKNIFATFGVIVASVAIVIAAVSIRTLVFQRTTPVQLSIQAQTSDIEGIDAQTAFLLKSSRVLSEDEIKKFIVFTPAVTFNVKKIVGGTSWIPAVYAAIRDTEEGTAMLDAAVYEIKPTEPLQEEKVYRVAVANDATIDTDKEYQWAFQVKAPFHILSTNPTDHGTAVPLNTGIEMIFNREDVLDPQSAFEISPKADGTFEQRKETFVFLPKALSEKTVYTITIKKGLNTDASGEILAEDYVFSFETGEKEYSGIAPSISFSREFAEFVPDKKPIIEVDANYAFDLKKDGKKTEVTVFSFAHVDDFLKAYRDGGTKGEQTWTLYQQKNTDDSSDVFAQYGKKEFTFKPKIISSDWQSFLELPKKLDRGYYALVLSYGKSHAYQWAVVTPLTHYYALSGEKSFLWLYDFASKKPIAHAAISALTPNDTEEALGATREDGLVEFVTPAVLQNREKVDGGLHADFFKIIFGEDEILVPAFAASETPASYWSYISSDRYTYQMTDTIRFWGVLKGKQEDLRGKKTHLDLRGGDEWTAIESTDATISQFDTVQGELAFKGAPPGYYTLELSVYDRVVQSIPIQIMDYVKPAYGITVTASKPAIFATDRVDFKVKAAFFDGTPVSGAELFYSGWWADEGIEGDIVLDEHGEGSVSYVPKYSTEEDQYLLNISFRSALSEEGEIWGNASVLVFGPSRHIQTFSEDAKNGSYRLKAKVNMLMLEKGGEKNPDLWGSEFIGGPAAGERLTARIIKHTYKKKEIGQYYDPINKIVQKTYDYWVEDTLIERITGMTDSSGEWAFEKSVPSQEDNWYEVVFEGKDEKGREYGSSETLWHFSGYNPSKEFALSLEKKDVGPEGSDKEYVAGEKIRLVARASGNKKDIVSPLLFFRAGVNIESIVIQKNTEYEDMFQESFIPVVRYRAVTLGPYGFEESNEAIARFSTKDRGLSIDMQPDKSQYQPGDLVTLDISVQNTEKKGVVSEVNLAAIDESLYHMLPYVFEQNVLETLYMSAENVPWIMTNAAQYLQLNKTAATEGFGCFIGDTPIRMADGSQKSIQDVRIGDRVSTFASESDHTRVSAIVQGISWHRVSGYMVVNGTLGVTPEHRILINGIWQPAGALKKGDMLLGADGKPVFVSSVEYVEKGNTLVYNIVVGRYHTYIADDKFVHNQEKGGGDVRERQKFVDAALYESVRTDVHGRARTTFTAPDTITSWRVFAQGFAPDGIRAGQTTIPISVSLPFFIDTTIAQTYLVGDNPVIRARVFGNALKQDQDVEFVVKSDALHIDKKETVKGNEWSFALGDLPEGRYDLKISASQATLKDSIVRPITVLQSYFRKYEAASYDLARLPETIEGKKDGYTDLAFMDMGRGKFYDALHKNLYESGIRVDQVVGAQVAAKFLSDYFGEKSADITATDLGGYQSGDPSDGGIGLFPYSGHDLELTAKISDLASDAISQSAVRAYFEATLNDEKTDIHRVVQALYGLSVFNDPVLSKVKKVRQKTKDLTLEDTIYLTLALVRFGDFSSARDAYEKDIHTHLRFDGPQSWLDEEQDTTRRVKLTGAIGIIASELGYIDDANALWEYMNTHDPERDLDTLEELLFMRSALEKAGEEKALFTYRTATRGEDVSLENGYVHHLTLSTDELNTLRFSGIRGNVRMIAVFERNRNPDELVKNGALSIRRSYLLDDKPVTEFKDGDIVRVQLDPDIADSAPDGTYQVVDYLPSGLRPIMQTYQLGLEDTGTTCDPTWYPVRIQHDAIYFLTYKGFDETAQCRNRTINYYARVVTKGTYHANPSLIQSMQNMESLNVSRQDTVTIK